MHHHVAAAELQAASEAHVDAGSHRHFVLVPDWLTEIFLKQYPSIRKLQGGKSNPKSAVGAWLFRLPGGCGFVLLERFHSFDQ